MLHVCWIYGFVLLKHFLAKVWRSDLTNHWAKKIPFWLSVTNRSAFCLYAFVWNQNRGWRNLFNWDISVETVSLQYVRVTGSSQPDSELNSDNTSKVKTRGQVQEHLFWLHPLSSISLTFYHIDWHMDGERFLISYYQSWKVSQGYVRNQNAESSTWWLDQNV